MDSENFKQRSIDHAWRYFELHAQQRMTVFNFYLAISGLISAGIGVCLQEGPEFLLLVSLLGFFLSLISLLFWKLDQRTSEMIKLAESALRGLEKEAIYPIAAIFSKDLHDSPAKGFTSIWSYGRCFRLAFLVVGVTGLTLAISPSLIGLLSNP